MGLLKAGDHVVCSRSVFGSTIKLLGRASSRKFGVETTFVSQTDVAEWRAALQAQHQAAVRRNADQSADRGLRHPPRWPSSRTAPARCSPSTTASARRRCSARPKMGADLIIHSGTKYLDGPGPRDRRRDLRPSAKLDRRGVHARDAHAPACRCRRSTPGSCSRAWRRCRSACRRRPRVRRAGRMAGGAAAGIERVYYPGLEVASAA